TPPSVNFLPLYVPAPKGPDKAGMAWCALYNINPAICSTDSFDAKSFARTSAGSRQSSYLSRCPFLLRSLKVSPPTVNIFTPDLDEYPSVGPCGFFISIIPDVSLDLLARVHNRPDEDAMVREFRGKTISNAETPIMTGKILTCNFFFIIIGLKPAAQAIV